MRLLLLSNSTLPGEPFLGWAMPHLDAFLGKPSRIAFVPFAAVGMDHAAYTERVAAVMRGMGHEVTGLLEDHDPIGVVEQADVIAVGGGNSFQLLRLLHRHDLVRAIRSKVKDGAPYIGWSAGSNVACPTIMTTNDMPITEPPTFRALGLVSFQINPHYTELTIPGHGGESRDQRIAEFLALNPTTVVAGLREGAALRVEHGATHLIGKGMRVFRQGQSPKDITREGPLRPDLSPKEG